MLVVDQDLLTKLGTTPHDVYETYVTADKAGNVVQRPTPYLVFASSIGSLHQPRLHGRKTATSVFFRVMYVGETREQAKGAGEDARAVLVGKRVTVGGVRRSGLIEVDESQQIRRDDDAIKTDGRPLFCGVDLYSVSLTLDSEGVPS